MKNTYEDTQTERRPSGRHGHGCGCGCGCGKSHAHGSRFVDDEGFTADDRVVLEEQRKDLEQQLADVTAKIRTLD